MVLIFVHDLAKQKLRWRLVKFPLCF